MITRQWLRDLASRAEDWLFRFVSNVNLGFKMSPVSVRTQVPRCMAPRLKVLFKELGRPDEIGARYRRVALDALANCHPESDPD